jgi:hypothetical protein
MCTTTVSIPEQHRRYYLSNISIDLSLYLSNISIYHIGSSLWSVGYTCFVAIIITVNLKLFFVFSHFFIGNLCLFLFNYHIIYVYVYFYLIIIFINLTIYLSNYHFDYLSRKFNIIMYSCYEFRYNII